MREDTVFVAQFCDDIRRELGNKYSLIGCYNEDLQVESLPVMLSKLCVQTKFVCPLSMRLEKLTIRVRLGADQIGEIEVPVPEPKVRNYPNEKHTVVSLFVFSPLAIQEAKTMVVEAELDGEKFIGGTLLIHTLPTPGSSKND